jgi:hypothetical protein
MVAGKKPYVGEINWLNFSIVYESFFNGNLFNKNCIDHCNNISEVNFTQKIFTKTTQILNNSSSTTQGINKYFSFSNSSNENKKKTKTNHNLINIDA